MKTINKTNINYIDNINLNDHVEILVFSDSRIDRSLSIEYGVMISRESILSGRYCYTPLIHDDDQVFAARSNYIYYIDKGVDRKLISDIIRSDSTIKLKTLSSDTHINQLLETIDPELTPDLDLLDSYLHNSCSKGLLEARGDYTNFLFDKYLDYEKAKSICSSLSDKHDLNCSDVDLVFNSYQSERLKGFRLKELSLFDKIYVNADEFSGAELYEIKVKLSKQVGLSNFVFNSRSKVKSSLLAGDFSFDDVIKIKGRVSNVFKDDGLTVL